MITRLGIIFHLQVPVVWGTTPVLQWSVRPTSGAQSQITILSRFPQSLKIHGLFMGRHSRLDLACQSLSIGWFFR